jgi:O-antigen/teichoic acid export membrane protein
VVVAIAMRILRQIPTIWFVYRIAPALRFGWRGAKRQAARTVASFSWPIFLLYLGGRLGAETDPIVIGASLPISAVTPYSIARQLSTLPLMVVEQFLRLVLPMASELDAEQDHTQLRALYVTSTRLTIAVFLPIGCVLAMLAEPILRMWLGSGYAAHAPLVGMLLLAGLIDIILWPANFVLQGMARHSVPAIVALASGLCNLALSLILVRRWQLTGVALGTLIPTTLAAFGLVLPYALRVTRVSARTIIKRAFLPTLVPVIPMVCVIRALEVVVEPQYVFSLVAVAAAGLLVYLVAYFGVGASSVERETSRRMVRAAADFAREYLARPWSKRTA